MNLSEISLLLGTISAFDLRVQVDELKVRAWSEVLDTDLDLEEARQAVFHHYANFETAITPSNINREWRRRKTEGLIREKSERLSLEFQRASEEKASPEIVAKYLSEIREILRRKDASLEVDSQQMASDS
jgi:hypothetical protein